MIVSADANLFRFRHIVDARLALTLWHHGITHFATANEKHFSGFGFEQAWNPVELISPTSGNSTRARE